MRANILYDTYHVPDTMLSKYVHFLNIYILKKKKPQEVLLLSFHELGS